MALTSLRRDVWWADQVAPTEHPTTPSGWDALDAALPGGGWPLGALIELAIPSHGLPWRLLHPALQAAAGQGRLVLIGLPLEPDAHAWAAQGVPPERLLRLTPSRDADALWAAEQALRCPDVTLCWLHWQRPATAWMRRLQVAASAARCDSTRPGAWPAPLVLASVPAAQAPAASPAPLRLAVGAGDADGLWVHLRKRRGPPLPSPVHLAAPLAWRRLLPDGPDATASCPSHLAPSSHRSGHGSLDRLPARLRLAHA